MKCAAWCSEYASNEFTFSNATAGAGAFSYKISLPRSAANATQTMASQTITVMQLQAPCVPRAVPMALNSPICRRTHAVGRQTDLASPLLRPSACIRSRRNILQVSAVASAQPSTVKIITQGKNVEVTDSLKKYVVRLHSCPFQRDEALINASILFSKDVAFHTPCFRTCNCSGLSQTAP